MLFLLAPGPGVVFSSMPSGVVYTSDYDALVRVTNGSIADQLALQVAGCKTLSPNQSMFVYTTVSAAEADVSLPNGAFFWISPSAYGGVGDFYQKNSSSSATFLGTVYSIGQANTAQDVVDAEAASAAAAVSANAAASQASAALASASSASGSALSATASAGTSSAQAELARQAVQSAAIYKIYGTKSAAIADLSNIPANAWVEVEIDESQNNLRTRYQKVSGVFSSAYLMNGAQNVKPVVTVTSTTVLTLSHGQILADTSSADIIFTAPTDLVTSGFVLSIPIIMIGSGGHAAIITLDGTLATEIGRIINVNDASGVGCLTVHLYNGLVRLTGNP